MRRNALQITLFIQHFVKRGEVLVNELVGMAQTARRKIYDQLNAWHLKNPRQKEFLVYSRIKHQQERPGGIDFQLT